MVVGGGEAVIFKVKYKLPNEISLDLEDRQYLILTEKKKDE